MEAQIFDSEGLVDSLNQKIGQLREQLKDGKIDANELSEQLLEERELLISALVEQRQDSRRYSFSESRLYLPSIPIHTLNQIEILSQKLEVDRGYFLSYLMKKVIKKGSFDLMAHDLQDMVQNLIQRRQNYGIHHHDYLLITAKDLKELNDWSGSFHHIQKLEFDESVTPEIFEKYVRGIHHCNTVIVSSSIPQLLLFSKTWFCQNYKIR